MPTGIPWHHEKIRRHQLALELELDDELKEDVEQDHDKEPPRHRRKSALAQLLVALGAESP